MKNRLAIPFFLFLLGLGAGALLHSLTTRKQIDTAQSVGPQAPDQAQRHRELRTATGADGSMMLDAGTRLGSPFHWSELESTDFKVYIANLRAIGCPEETIHDIIRAELDNLYEPRHRELEQEDEEGHDKFWELRRGRSPAVEFARHISHRSLDRDREALLRELLGLPLEEDHAPGSGENAPDASQEGEFHLAPETRERVHEIQEKYAHLKDDIYHNALGEIYPDDALALQELEDQRLEELQALLTPEELREFELRESPTAEHMRHQLVAFQPTEAEFRSIFDLRRSFEDEFGEHHFEIPDEEYRENREAAEQQMNEQIEAILGEERFGEYELATDHHYRELYRLGDRFGVPMEGIRQMHDLWQSSERQVDQIHGNESLTGDERRLAMAELRQEVESKGLEYLGDEAYFNYQATGGEWIRHLFE